MICREITVTNHVGFHARPASLLIQTVQKFKSQVSLSKGDQMVDMKSIVSLLKLRVKCGDIIALSAEGSDEAVVIDALAALIESNFGEE